jgi:hypothetical protein
MSQQEAALGPAYTGHSPVPAKNRSIAWFLCFIAVSVLLGAMGWLFIAKVEYTPGSNLGYNLGLIGGVAMLLILLYSVAKRVRFMHSWIQMRYWFYAHMVFGIVGPIFILFHSKLTLESINGTLAFCSMWLVFSSGIVGRFLSSRIHHGLNRKRAILQELKQRIGIRAEDMRSKFHFVPRVNAHLEEFEASVLTPSKGLCLNLWHFLALPFRFEWVYFLACRDLKRGIKARAQKRAWDSRKTRKRLTYGKKIIRAYLDAVRSVARSGAYKQLFSLWHIIHLPLIIWLAITGAIHVLAVHMY